MSWPCIVLGKAANSTRRMAVGAERYASLSAK